MINSNIKALYMVYLKPDPRSEYMDFRDAIVHTEHSKVAYRIIFTIAKHNTVLNLSLYDNKKWNTKWGVVKIK